MRKGKKKEQPSKAVTQRLNEINAHKKRVAWAEKRAAEKKRQQEIKAQAAVWIDSTQSCTHVADVVDSIIITTDKRYIKLIEVLPQNFEMLSMSKQNAIGSAFGGLLNTVPYRVQFKCFSRKGDVEELISIMRDNMSGETNDVCLAMQEDYLQLIRKTAHSVGVKRRFFIIIEHKDNVVADGSNFDDIKYNLNSFAARFSSLLRECGNAVLDTGNTEMGVNSVLYELLNRKKAETTPFAQHVQPIITQYENEIEKNEESGQSMEFPSANEFFSPEAMDFTKPRYCAVDGKYYSFYFLDSDGYLNSPVPTGWLNNLINMGEGIDLDIFVDRIPQDRIREKIQRNQRFNVTKRQYGENMDAYDMQSRLQAGSYIMRAMAAQQEYFEVSILLTICADTLTDLQYNETQVLRSTKAMGLKFRGCFYQEEEAFYSVLPLCNLDKHIRAKSWRNMMTDGAASLYPFLSFELQDPKGIMLGVNAANNSLVSLDLFDTTRHVNANVSIMGKSGYGKTFTAQLLAVRERLQGIQVFIITPLKGREDYKRTCDKIQGQYLAMGPGTPYYINIFDITAPDKSVMDEDMGFAKSLLAQKVQSLHTFFHLIYKNISLAEDSLLDRYIYKTYNKYGITNDNESIYVPGTQKYREMPTLGDLYDMIADDPELHNVRYIMEPYVNGAHSEFNKHTNVDLSNKYICFDMDGLNGDDLTLSLFVALDFVWRKIKENKAEKKAVFIDEIWKLIGVEGNDMAANYCVEIFKTIRAYGGSAVSMTQEVSDFFKLKGGAYGKGIIAASDTKICLRLDSGELKKMEEIMELSEQELEQVPKLPRGTGLLVTGSARVQARFTASQKEHYVISTDPEIARKEQAEARKRRQALNRLNEAQKNSNKDNEE